MISTGESFIYGEMISDTETTQTWTFSCSTTVATNMGQAGGRYLSVASQWTHKISE